MRSGAKVGLFIVVVVILILLFTSLYILNETEQAIITQFGEPIGDPVVTAGIHLKVPFIQKVLVFEKRLLEWDGEPQEIPTRDNKFIRIDTFARWRISDALAFYKTMRNEITAHSRLDDLLDGAVRDEIANRRLPEIVRSSDRPMIVKEVETVDVEDVSDTSATREIYVYGARKDIAEAITKSVQDKLESLVLGIEVIDLKFKRIDYNPEVQQKVFSRMVSQQNRIAEKYRAIGQGQKQRILGQQAQKKKELISKAYLEAQKIRGDADGKAIRIYANAYDKNADSREFYSFLRTMEAYETTMDSTTTLILSTDNEFLRYLDHSE